MIHIPNGRMTLPAIFPGLTDIRESPLRHGSAPVCHVGNACVAMLLALKLSKADVSTRRLCSRLYEKALAILKKACIERKARAISCRSVGWRSVSNDQHRHHVIILIIFIVIIMFIRIMIRVSILSVAILLSVIIIVITTTFLITHKSRLTLMIIALW